MRRGIAGEERRGDEGLDLGEERPGALDRADDGAAGLLARPLLEKEGRRVGDGLEPGGRHLENRQLRDGAEPVFHGPQDAVAVVPLALEKEDDIDHVLEGLGPGQRAVLGDVADQEGGDLAALGETEDLVGRLPDLADRARARGHLGRENGLDGVHDEDLGREPLGLGQDAFEVGLGQKIEPPVPDAQPVAPELDLLQGFLAGNVEDRGLPGGHIPGNLEEEGRLADAGLAADRGRASPRRGRRRGPC